MSQTTTYNTTVTWKGEHWGHLKMGNGPQYIFSAPPDAEGHAGVLTPEDAFVAAVNSCVMLMFIWAAERFKLNLLSYECYGEGTKLVELDRTERFSTICLQPHIRIAAEESQREGVAARVQRALQAARKYSLIANSITAELSVEPRIEIVSEGPSGAYG